MKILKKILQVSLLIILFMACSNDDEPSLNPTIKSISPTSGPKTTTVTINGNDFGTDISKTQVFFNEVEAVVQDVVNSKITAVVPVRAFTGVVKVISNGKTLTGPEFTYTISDVQVTTFTGSTQGFADGTSTVAQFNRPSGIAIDSKNNVYVADYDNHKIRKITSNGVVTTLAGSTQGFADGTGNLAQFNYPSGVAIDSEDNVYVVDSGNHKIRKITPNGVVSTIAGSTGGFTDGEASTAQFFYPYGLAIDSKNNIYVADASNHKIRKITSSGVVSTVAGSTQGFADGIGSTAKFRYPFGIVLDSENNIYVADARTHRIRKITPEGMVSTFAGGTGGFADGSGNIAQFALPWGVSIDSENNIYVADFGNHKIRKITPDREVSTIAGSTQGFGDGVGNSAQFNTPYGVAIDSDNNIYVADGSNHKIRKITQE